MKILMVSTLKRRIGSDIFASRSRIIYQLSKGLAERDHSVSLLGTADSEIPGVEIIPVIDKGWVDLPLPENVFHRDIATLMKQAGMMLDLQGLFDVIHNHTVPDFFPSIVEPELNKSLVTTLHALHADYIDELISKYKKTHFIALSQAYKNLYKKASIYDVVYNGIDENLYAYKEKKGDYLFWLGRLAEGKKENGEYIDQKGVGWAIKLAEETDSKLIMAGQCEDKKFFDKDVAPHLNEKIQWYGEVSREQSLPVEKVVKLMQEAKAFLMTINQEEPFGLVIAEAMSCGTPVIGFDRGAVSELVVDGKTGFVVPPSEGLEGLKKALQKISDINPADCTRRVEENFTIEKMVEAYENVYKKVINK